MIPLVANRVAFVYTVVREVNPASAIDTAHETLYKRYYMALKPKRKAGRKDKGIFIRVTGPQKRELATTAKSAGLGLSSWMLSLALREAHKMKSA